MIPFIQKYLVDYCDASDEVITSDHIQPKKVGQKVAIIGSGPAGLAAAAGLPMEEAWHAITINPAKSLGIADRVGSLEPGKDADLVLWTADPLTTVGGEAYMTIVNGEIVYQAE